MRVLVVKTSSLGDLIHTLPALTDAAAARPGIRFDWVAEEAFAEVPAWHPVVDRVIPIALRRWRREWWRSLRTGAVRRFLSDLQRTDYDVVIDAQGLLPKSAWVACRARGASWGYGPGSARDPFASLCYRHRVGVPRDLHAIDRIRRLFAAALGYTAPETEPDYGLRFDGERGPGRPALLFLHGTSWPSKHWPDPYWVALAQRASEEGYAVHWPWGDEKEQQRAERLIAASHSGWLLPHLSLTQIAKTLAGAAGAVGLDSGLAHLAAAVGTPAVTLYGPTRTDLTGARGEHQYNMQADFPCAPCMKKECAYEGDRPVDPPCFQTLPPDKVWRRLKHQMGAV